MKDANHSLTVERSQVICLGGTLGNDNSFEQLLNRRLASDSPQLNVPILKLPNTHAQRFMLNVSIVLQPKGAVLESKDAVLESKVAVWEPTGAALKPTGAAPEPKGATSEPSGFQWRCFGP